MPGTDVNRFVGLNPSVASNLFCGICRDILVDPHNTACDHTFCMDCIVTAFRTDPNWPFLCPLCRRELDNNSNRTIRVTQNRIVANIINDLRVKCSYESNGCQVVVAFGQLATHERSCPFRTCQCGLVAATGQPHNCLNLLKKRNEELQIALVVKDQIIEGKDEINAEKDQIIEGLNQIIDDLNSERGKKEKKSQQKEKRG